MSNRNELIQELGVLIKETSTPIEVRAAKVVDDLLIRYADIYQNDPTFRSIGDMAIKIHTAKATEGENGVMWAEVIHLTHKMMES